jgi:hypothetical protein
MAVTGLNGDVNALRVQQVLGGESFVIEELAAGEVETGTGSWKLETDI